MFFVDYASGVAQDLAGLRAFERARILDQIEEQLTEQPTQETRNKKLLPGLKPPWDQELPIWELRVGEYRVFYDVDDTECLSHGAGDPPKAAPRHHGGNPMKTLGIEQATLDACVRESQGERVLVTRGGRPVAMVLGLADLDDDQLQLGRSDKFWQLITARRKQPTVSRAELERMAAASDVT